MKYIVLPAAILLTAGSSIIWSISADVGPATAAKEVVESCASSEHPPTCYERSIPPLLDEMPLASVFAVIREVRKQDSSYQFCHVLAHELGAREVAKDPQNWIDVVAQNPQDGLCSNGLIHGGALERFNQEVFSPGELEEQVIPELKLACEAREGWQPTQLDRAMCYHGIGHLAVHLTEADIESALTVCDEVIEGRKEMRRVCQEGVFMQLFQPLEPEDYALIEQLPQPPTKESLDTFCSGRGQAADAACWREGWPLYQEEILTAEGMTTFCARESAGPLRDACFDTTMAILGRYTLGDPEYSAALCNALPDERQEQCFSRVALSFVEEDRAQGARAAQFCGHAEDEGVRQACYAFLTNASTFVYHPTDQHKNTLCGALPSPWGERCRAQ